MNVCCWNGKRSSRLLLILLILCSVPLVGVRSQTADKKISYQCKNEKLSTTLENLERMSGFYKLQFAYVEVEGYSVTIDLKNVTVPQAVERLVMDKPLTFSVENQFIYVRKAKVKSTSYTIRGEVSDENGQPLIGATVRDVNGRGVVTDIDGKFTIQAAEGTKLLFSYIGKKSHETRIMSDKQLHIVLADDINSMDELVVTGYQTMSRRESASAIATVKAEDVLTPSAMSIDQMLQGRIPGMSVQMQSGEPSSTPTVRIRGNSTINGNKAPVWVVDGVIMSDAVPFTASDLTSPDATYLIGNSIAGLSPQDIESISVLKDASATAIYGVKAANGVVVITTKRGSVSAPRVTYDGSFNVNTRPYYSQFDQMNSQERVQLSKEIYDARLRYPRTPTSQSYEGALMQLQNKEITQSEFEALVRKYELMNTDWFDYLFRPTVTQNHSVSVTGGSEKVRYYTSLSYNNSPGIAKGSESDRFTGLGKLFVKINRIFDVDVKLELSNQKNEGYSSVNPFTYAFNTSRAIPAYEDDGDYYYYNRYTYSTVSYNVLNELNETGKRSNTRRLGGVMNFNAHILKGLTYTGTFSYYWTNNRLLSWATDHSYEVGTIRGYDYGAYEKGDDKYEQSKLPFGGTRSESNTWSRSYTLRNTLNYIATFADKHDVNLFGGIEVRSEKYSGSSVLAYGWDPSYGQSVSPVYTDQYIAAAESGTFNPTITEKITQVASYIGSASYTYDNRYVINANVRSDGSNKFGSNPKYRWLPTWSFAGKWIASNEKFISKLNFVDLLALRLSYGIQGNIIDDATPYLIVQMGSVDSTSGLRPGTIDRVPNPDLRWEKTHSYNIGLDASFFDNRLNFTLDYYQKHTSDLITDMNVSPTTGRSYMSMNSGKATNKGFEGVISADLIRNKLFDWNVSFNFSHNTNEIEYAYDAQLTDTERYTKMLAGNYAAVGQPLGTIYSFKFAGLSSETGYPLFYTTDGRKVHEGDYQVMELVPCGSIYPDLSGGFDTRLTYKKNLSLSIGFSYQFGAVRRLPSIYGDSTKAFDPVSNVPKSLANRWKKSGDENYTNIPALFDTRVIDNFTADQQGRYESDGVMDVYMATMYDYSDIRVAKSDFVRLRNVTLSYRLPKKCLSKLNIKDLTIRLQGSNLFLWAPSAWDGLDPETAYANMPVMPSYSLGVSATF